MAEKVLDNLENGKYEICIEMLRNAIHTYPQMSGAIRCLSDYTEEKMTAPSTTYSSPADSMNSSDSFDSFDTFDSFDSFGSYDSGKSDDPVDSMDIDIPKPVVHTNSMNNTGTFVDDMAAVFTADAGIPFRRKRPTRLLSKLQEPGSSEGYYRTDQQLTGRCYRRQSDRSRYSEFSGEGSYQALKQAGLAE